MSEGGCKRTRGLCSLCCAVRSVRWFDTEFQDGIDPQYLVVLPDGTNVPIPAQVFKPHSTTPPSTEQPPSAALPANLQTPTNTSKRKSVTTPNTSTNTNNNSNGHSNGKLCADCMKEIENVVRSSASSKNTSHTTTSKRGSNASMERFSTAGDFARVCVHLMNLDPVQRTLAKIDSVLDGSCEEFQAMVKPYQEICNARIARAKQQRDQQLVSLEALHSHTLVRIEQEHKHDLTHLRGRIQSEVNDRYNRKRQFPTPTPPPILDDSGNHDHDDDDELADLIGSRLERKKPRRTVENDREDITKHRVLPQTILSVTDRTAQDDLAAMYKNFNRHNRNALKGAVEDHRVGCDSADVLTYDGRKLQRGTQVSVISGSSQHRYSASILSVSNIEVVLKKTDGAKSKISLAHLRSGKWSLMEKTGHSG